MQKINRNPPNRIPDDRHPEELSLATAFAHVLVTVKRSQSGGFDVPGVATDARRRLEKHLNETFARPEIYTAFSGQYVIEIECTVEKFIP